MKDIAIGDWRHWRSSTRLETDYCIHIRALPKGKNKYYFLATVIAKFNTNYHSSLVALQRGMYLVYSTY